MTNTNNDCATDIDNIVRILDMRASINHGVEVQIQRIKELTETLTQPGCGPIRDHILQEIGARSRDLQLWTEIGQQFEDLPLRSPPDDTPINYDEIDAAIAAEDQEPEVSLEEEVAYIIHRVEADLIKCQAARAEFEALTICLTGKASYIGSMKHLVAKRRGLYFDEWLVADICDYAQSYDELGWHHERCDILLEQLFQSLRAVDAAETTYNELWRESPV